MYQLSGKLNVFFKLISTKGSVRVRDKVKEKRKKIMIIINEYGYDTND